MYPKKLQLFSAGTHKDSRSQELDMSLSALQSLAAALNKAGARVPLVIGHPKDNSSPKGFATAFGMDGDRLVATKVEGLDPTLAEAVRAGQMNQLSVKILKPGHKDNPLGAAGQWLDHIGFFGRQKVALPHLQVEFSAPEDDPDAFELAFAMAQEPEGEEETEVDEAEEAPEEEAAEPEGPKPRKNRKPKSKAMTKAVEETEITSAADDLEARFAAQVEALERKQAELERRNQELAAEQGRRERLNDAAERLQPLVANGKVTPAEAKDLALCFSYLDGDTADEYTFSEGDQSLSEYLFSFLEGLPNRVEYAMFSSPGDEDEEDEDEMAFSAPGQAVVRDSAAIHNAAIKAGHAPGSPAYLRFVSRSK